MNKRNDSPIDALVKRCVIEGHALWRTFHFRDENNDMKKFVMFVLVVTWGVITVGIAFEEAQVTPAYSMLTALIWAVVGRLWGGEVKDLTKGSNEMQ